MFHLPFTHSFQQRAAGASTLEQNKLGELEEESGGQHGWNVDTKEIESDEVEDCFLCTACIFVRFGAFI